MDGKFVRLINESVQKYFCVSASMGRHYCIFKKNVIQTQKMMRTV